MRREKEKQAVVPRTLMKDDFFFLEKVSMDGLAWKYPVWRAIWGAAHA